MTSELRPGTQLTRLDTALSTEEGTLEVRSFEGSALRFPLELRTTALEEGTRVRLEFAAFQGDRALYEGWAETDVAGERVLLVPTSIDLECAALGAPVCDGATTCSDGACVDGYLAPTDAADYYEGWAGTQGGDRCEPGGDPEVTVGRGQADYLDFAEGETLQVEAGPQGGYHVWVAARLRNLKQSGSIIELSGRALDRGEDLPSMTVAFSFDPDEGGWCKIFGLRFRLDDMDTPIDALLGERVSITVTITDPDGDVGTATKEAILSDSFL